MITPLRPATQSRLCRQGLHRRRRRIAPLNVFSATIFRLRPRLEVMEDRTLLSTFLVSNTSDSGTGSLRQAILDSNAAIGTTNTVDFDISGTGVETIAPLSSLPTITSPVLIDGFSQPNFSDTPLIELSGGGSGGGDGLTITSAGVTIRGLDIDRFGGAGIHLTGTGATGDWIYGNFLGTDPTGTQAQYYYVLHQYGVEIDGGASGNLIGTNGDGIDDSAERNLISGNGVAGVWINGEGTDGNAVAGNLIGTTVTGDVSLANGTSYVSYYYSDIIPGGVVIEGGASGNRIGTDGLSVDDTGQRNIISGSASPYGTRWGVVLDGSSDCGVAGNSIGTDATGSASLPNSAGGIKIYNGSSDNTIGGAAALAGNLITNNGGPGVVVGDNASDLSIGNQITANRIIANTGQAIDLGDDGVTGNSTSPRQGPNNLQNFPIFVMTSDGQVEGWLGGSTPDTTFRLDLFASAGYGPGGAGEAQDYLGSLEVTTDATGRASFIEPFTVPAGLPIITGTATDPQGNTSEFSALRPAVLQAPEQSVHVTPGQPLIFSTASGDGIAIQDPDAGPLSPVWSVTLSVSAGTLTLSSTAGLTGSGEGTGSLSYSGPLATLDASLDGMIFNPPAGPHVFTTLTISGQSFGAQPAQTQIVLTDGVFVVDTTADSGPGSLRQAILDSDTTTGATNTIDFAIPGNGIQTIAPISPVPAISSPVLIDGFSQPDYAGTPLIELSGQSTRYSDGLTITGSGTTIRGLDINGFALGAGVVISGSAATGNLIEANDIGTDPTGSLARPNDFGVRILNGAHDNLVGGATPPVGNLIAFNTELGVDVEGVGSIGNQITANRIFANNVSPTAEALGALQFDGSSFVTLPNDLIRSFSQNETIEAWFRTTGGGVILSYQDKDPSAQGFPDYWFPALYVGNDGKLYGELQRYGDNLMMASPGVVNDGRWHYAALVVDGASQTQTLYLDGQRVASLSGPIATTGFLAFMNQVGTGYTAQLPAAPAAWYGFTGRIGEVAIWSVPRSTDEVREDMTASPRGLDPNLVADYPFDEGQGLTAHDQTLNHRDGTLAGIDGQLPTWSSTNGLAIDLGNDGVTNNSTGPRQGPNDLQNFPIVVTTAAGQLQGWLGGSTPDTSFDLEFFASAGYSSGGAGQAQVYLGSFEVTTDDHGQAAFDVPFTVPVDMPLVTATATDPQGDTSEISALRQTSLQAPTQSIRLVTGQPLVFSADTGDGLALADPDAGPFDSEWDLTLSVAAGTLTLSGTDGLVGLGDGTRTLGYRGTLSALNAALDGLSFTPPPGFHGNTTLTLSAQSDGAASPVELLITDGVFAVTTIADSGPGSLRQAILDSNIATGGANIIDFALPGPGVQTIAPSSPLPLITRAVLIDGSSQPGYAGTPLIALGSRSVEGSGVLTLTDGAVTVRGLVIDSLAIVTTTDEQLVAQVNGEGITTRLSLLDSQGQMLVQSDGLSPSDPDDLIDQDLAPGTYFLEVADSGWHGSDYALDGRGHASIPVPFQPITAGNAPARGVIAGPVVTGDFNGDGIPDFASADGVHLGVGDGTFRNPSVALASNAVPAGDFVTEMISGDFTGDGKLDLVAEYRGLPAFFGGNNHLIPVNVVFLGNGDGTFQPAKTFAAGSRLSSLVAGDFNGDGRLDLAVYDSDGVQMLLGNGDGTFQPAETVATGNFGSMVAGDFNSDGLLDLAVANYDLNGVSVLLGKGDGTFQLAVTSTEGSTPDSIIAGDFNGDGRLDLAASYPGSSDGDLPKGVTILLGNGEGTFLPQQRFAAGEGGGSSLAVGDFNGDGRLDLASVDSFTGGISVLLGNGDGAFQSQKQFQVGTQAETVVASDFNGDGRLDLAVAYSGLGSPGVNILLGNGDGSFRRRQLGATGLGPYAEVAGDFNGDGRLDLATANESSMSVSILLGNADGTFRSQQEIIIEAPITLYGSEYYAGQSSISLVAGDFNGDGRLDLVAVTEYRWERVGAAGQRRRHVPGPEAVHCAEFNSHGLQWRAISTATAASTWRW